MAQIDKILCDLEHLRVLGIHHKANLKLSLNALPVLRIVIVFYYYVFKVNALFYCRLLNDGPWATSAEKWAVACPRVLVKRALCLIGGLL